MPSLQKQNAPQEGWMEAMPSEMRNRSAGTDFARSVGARADGTRGLDQSSFETDRTGAVATGNDEVGAPGEGNVEVGTPDFFLGTSFAVDEILLGLNVLTAKAKALKEGNVNKAAVTQKLQAESVAKIAGQIQLLADMLARVTIAHVNRKPRA